MYRLAVPLSSKFCWKQISSGMNIIRGGPGDMEENTTCDIFTGMGHHSLEVGIPSTAAVPVIPEIIFRPSSFLGVCDVSPQKCCFPRIPVLLTYQ